MKNILLLASVLTLTFFTYAQTDKEPYLTQSLSGENIKEARVETSGGSIHVTGVEPGQARIEVYVTPNNPKNKYSQDELKRKLEKDYVIDISTSGGKLTAIAKQRNAKLFDWNNSLNISFRVFIPSNVNTDLHTSGGSIHLANLNGTHDFRTSGGSLRIDKLSGNIKGRTSGGSILLRHSSSEIDLHTSGGNITAEDCNGNLRLRTSGGSLTLKSLSGTINARTSGGSVHGDAIKGELEAHTSGGNVTLKNLAASVDASTSGGGINVELVELGKYVTIRNSGGNVTLALPGNQGMNLKLKGDRINTGSLKNFSGTLEQDEVEGTLNGGGVPVTVRSSSGRVSLSLK
jgi:hypothetical protein